MPDAAFDRPIMEQTVEEISPEPLVLPAQYRWVNLDLSDDNVAQDCYDLLVRNYVADEDEMFRFDYSIPFLRWAICAPGFNPDWIIGVRGGKQDKLYGMITAIPVSILVNGIKV